MERDELMARLHQQLDRLGGLARELWDLLVTGTRLREIAAALGRSEPATGRRGAKQIGSWARSPLVLVRRCGGGAGTLLVEGREPARCRAVSVTGAGVGGSPRRHGGRPAASPAGVAGHVVGARAGTKRKRPGLP